MPSGVLSRMVEQTQHGARQSGPPYLPGYHQQLDGSVSNLVQCSIDLRQHRREEDGARKFRHAFLRERRELRFIERLAASVGKQAVETSGEVLEMIARACRITRALYPVPGAGADAGTPTAK